MYSFLPSTELSIALVAVFVALVPLLASTGCSNYLTGGELSTDPNRITQDFTMRNCQVFRGLPTWHPILLASDEEKMRAYADPAIRDKLHAEAVERSVPVNVVGFSKTWWDYMWVNEPALEKNRKLQFKSPFYVSRDIRLGIRAIKRAGAPAPRYFRAPHGFRSPWTTPIASSYGERTVGWSLGVWDSDRPCAEEIVKRTLEGVSPGSIILLHYGDGYNPDGDWIQTAAALPIIIYCMT